MNKAKTSLAPAAHQNARRMSAYQYQPHWLSAVREVYLKNSRSSASGPTLSSLEAESKCPLLIAVGFPAPSSLLAFLVSLAAVPSDNNKEQKSAQLCQDNTSPSSKWYAWGEILTTGSALLARHPLGLHTIGGFDAVVVVGILSCGLLGARLAC